MVVVEITEVSGAGDGDHLSDSGRRPTRDGVPHALAACKPSRGETITRHHSSLRESRTMQHSDGNKAGFNIKQSQVHFLIKKRLVSSSLRANKSILHNVKSIKWIY